MCWRPGWCGGTGPQIYLTESGYEVVLQKSISAQIRQPILCISDSEGQVDGLVGELIFAKRI